MNRFFAVAIASLLVSFCMAAPVSQRGAGSYTNVNVKNGQFSVRQTFHADLKSILTEFANLNCNAGVLCSTYIDTIFSVLLPNVYMIESFDGSATNSTGNFDLMSHIIIMPGKSAVANTIFDAVFPGLTVYPSTVVTYFAASANYTLGFLGSNINFAAQAYSALHSYTNIIEYNDKNGNKVYDAGEEVQIYDLAKDGWSTTYNEITVGKYKVHEVVSTSSDNVVVFTCHTSDFPVLDPNGVVIQPNATKCGIEINNFPFTGTGDYLALQATVVSGEGTFQGAESSQVTITPSNSQSLGGYYQWAVSAKATSSGNTQQIAVNANVTTVAGGPGSVKDFTANLAILASGKASADVRQVIFSFQTTTNPSAVSWDPSVGYGFQAVITNSAASVAASFVVIALAFLTLLF